MNARNHKILASPVWLPLIFSFLLFACESSYFDVHKVKEYENKYEKLSSKEYSNITSAIAEQDRFLDEITSENGSKLLARNPKLNSSVENVKLFRSEFIEMKTLFEKDFLDLASFNSEVTQKAQKYENSDFETVRASWRKIVDSERANQAEKDLSKKVAEFEEYLQNDAENICRYNFKDYDIDYANSIQTISIGSAHKRDTENGKVCEGVFRVFLKGAFFGWDKGTVKISVKGMFVITTDENNLESDVEYRNVDFKILERTGDLE
jgi:hypothetical protein